MRPSPVSGLVFRQHPAWPIFMAGVVGLTGGLGPLALRDPDFRAAVFFSVNPLTSVKFLVVTALIVFAWLIFIPLTRRVWRSASTFEVTPDRLIATHQFTRRRDEIPWGSIASVTQLPPSFLSQGAPMKFNRIEVTNGTDLLFSPLLGRYEQFVDELRPRVTCRVFDPCPWPRRRPC